MSDQPSSSVHRARHKGVLAIAILKLLKASLLLIIGFGAISLLHRDVSEIAERLMRFLHIDPTGRIFYKVIDKLSFVDDHRLRQVSTGTFFYAALMMTEGIGLLFEKRWAEWLTVLITSSFVPFEIYEIFKKPNTAKFTVLALNLFIVIYLVARLRERTPPDKKRSTESNQNMSEAR